MVTGKTVIIMNSDLIIKRIEFSKWENKYRPLLNKKNKYAGINGYLYQPYGKDLEIVYEHKDDHIWTLIISDLGSLAVWEITNGIHLVNREGFLITEMPAEKDLSIHVRY